ncbi:FixH family protein [Kitasatospora sp. NBC_01287]|uniref:copper resistance CopC/CopD family protein n=1 Tax=Kitasatospora sp. NBC_01287 TaxID=2903573 RepID=UPI00225202E6|nr:copper resistance protein CopC [Kitasatospora sp. NBC_01287]MCX4747880.1 FixH family protein [Kitasatospora sp. NBC_01287]
MLLRQARTWLATAGALLVLLIGTASPAAAHAALLQTDPAQNSVVATEPAAVTLTFSEGVTLSGDSVRVLDPGGKPVDLGNPGHADGRGDTATVGLRPGLGNGTYTVAWRAVSADTHVVGGAFTFSIGAPSDTSVSTSQIQGAQANGTVSALYGTGRAVAYGAFALLVGVAAFVLLCWPRGAQARSVQRLLMGGWVGLLAATVAVLLLRGPYEQGSGLGRVFDLSLVRGTLDERLGTALAARLLLLAAGGVFLSLLVGQLGQESAPVAATAPSGDAEEDELRRLERRAAERPLREARLALGVGGALLALGLAATWAAADHAAVGIQVWVALPFDMLHLVAMACWLGGLVALVLALRDGAGVAVADRFSKVALVSVAALVATGVYQAWRGVGSWGALVDTEYGRLLLIKVGLVLVMLGAAFFSRRWTARLRAGAGVPATADAAADQTDKADRADEADVERADVRVGAAIGLTADDSVTDSAGTESARTESAGTDIDAGPGLDPGRRAQLERQRAAVAAAGVRRAQDGSPTQAGLRRSVLIEAVVAIGVLVVTTLLTNAPPGRVAAQVAAASSGGGSAAAAAPSGGAGARTVELKIPYDTGGTEAGAKGTATLTVNPATTGANQLTLQVANGAGQPVDVPEAQLSFTLPDRDLGPLPVTLTKSGTGRWSGTAQIPLTGEWVAAVVVRSSDIDQDTETKQLTIG